MGVTTIAWTNWTWNPWVGCTRVSEGCDHCYMFRESQRYGGTPAVLRQTKPPKVDEPIRKKRDGSWKIPPGSLVFVCSWSDFFHEAADEWREAAWEVMLARPDLTFLILTKRPERMIAGVSDAPYVAYIGSPPPRRYTFVRDRERFGHIWLGVTAENQARFDGRWPVFNAIDWPGLKFLSYEPALGPLVLPAGALAPVHGALDWIICGGESGKKHRPFDLDWARSLRDQCVEAGIPFFLKQFSANKPESVPTLDGRRWIQRPANG